MKGDPKCYVVFMFSLFGYAYGEGRGNTLILMKMDSGGRVSNFKKNPTSKTKQSKAFYPTNSSILTSR